MKLLKEMPNLWLNLLYKITFAPNCKERSTIYKVYASVTVLFINVTTIWSFYLTVLDMEDHFVSATILEICSGLLANFHINVSVYTRFKKTEEIEQFLELISQTANHVSWWFPWKITIFVHFIFMSLLCLISYTYIETDNFNLFFYSFVRFLLYYFVIVSNLLFTTYIVMLKLRFKYLRKTLNKLVVISPEEEGNTWRTWLRNIKEVGSAYFRVSEFRKFYGELSNAVEIFNDVFGWQILALILSVATEILRAISTAIVISEYDEETVIDKMESICLQASWCLFMMAMGLVTAVICDMTTKEAQKTGIICYDILLDISTSSDNTNSEDSLKDELLILAKQAIHHTPCFTAAGFFVIDYTMLFGLLATITSYIIVLVQILT